MTPLIFLPGYDHENSVSPAKVPLRAYPLCCSRLWLRIVGPPLLLNEQERVVTLAPFEMECGAAEPLVWTMRALVLSRKGTQVPEVLRQKLDRDNLPQDERAFICNGVDLQWSLGSGFERGECPPSPTHQV